MWIDFISLFSINKHKKKKEISNRLNKIISKDNLAFKISNIVAKDHEIEIRIVPKIKKEINIIFNKVIKIILIIKFKISNLRKNQNKKGEDSDGKM